MTVLDQRAANLRAIIALVEQTLVLADDGGEFIVPALLSDALAAAQRELKQRPAPPTPKAGAPWCGLRSASLKQVSNELNNASLYLA